MTWRDVTWRDVDFDFGDVVRCDVIWCDVMWCDVTWRDVMWCDVTWRDVTWCDVMWCDVTWRDVMWCDVMWRDVTWRDVMWGDMMWCDVMWCDVTWRDVTWCDVMWCDVMWCDVMWCEWCDVMWCDDDAARNGWSFNRLYTTSFITGQASYNHCVQGAWPLLAEHSVIVRRPNDTTSLHAKQSRWAELAAAGQSTSAISSSLRGGCLYFLPKWRLTLAVRTRRRKQNNTGNRAMNLAYRTGVSQQTIFAFKKKQNSLNFWPTNMSNTSKCRIWCTLHT